MTDTLATFAEQVTNVAREVGVEGRLGGQANVPGAAGTWKDLTGNVNLLAANLTNQVRAIAEVATAVTKGRPDAIDSGRGPRRGRRAQRQHQHDDRQPARDDRPQPGAGLAEDQPRQVHAHAAGPARPRHRRPAAALGARRRWSTRSRAPSTRCCSDDRRDRAGAVAARRLRASATDQAERIEVGNGLVGQCALEKQRILLDQGAAALHAASTPASARHRPKNIVVLPVLFEGETKAVIELSSTAAVHRRPTSTFLEQLTQSIGVVLEHDRGDDADREPAAAVAAADDRAADAPDRAAADQRGARVEGASSWPNRTSRSSARTRKSSRRAARSKRRRPSSR